MKARRVGIIIFTICFIGVFVIYRHEVFDSKILKKSNNSENTKITEATKTESVKSVQKQIPKDEEYLYYKYYTSYGEFVFKKVLETKFVVEYPSKLGLPVGWSFSSTLISGSKDDIYRNYVSVLFERVNLSEHGPRTSFVFTGPQFSSFQYGILEFEWIPK